MCLLTVAVTLLTGCTANGRDSALVLPTPTTAEVTPEPSPTKAAQLPPVPPCQGADLTARWGSSDAFTAGQTVQSLFFRNGGRHACSLRTRLTALTGLRAGHVSAIPLVVPAKSARSPARLEPGESGIAYLYVQRGCDRVSFPSMPARRSYSDLRVTLLGTSLPIADDALPGGVLEGCFTRLSADLAAAPW